MEASTISTVFAEEGILLEGGPHGSGTVVSYSYAILLEEHDLLS